MNVATVITIEAILSETRPADPFDYTEWGARAGRALAEHPEEAVAVLIAAMTARARGRIAREASRTRDGLARMVADAETGQMSVWETWTSAPKLRLVGRSFIAEGQTKLRLGQLMQQAADCIDAHPGLTAREAWAAEGLDVGELDAAADDAEAATAAL